jgi:hypothetical protein
VGGGRATKGVCPTVRGEEDAKHVILDFAETAG